MCVCDFAFVFICNRWFEGVEVKKVALEERQKKAFERTTTRLIIVFEQRFHPLNNNINKTKKKQHLTILHNQMVKGRNALE